ncbi:MAG: serine protein kinase RIO [Candidatus Micrarchaeia archaeon]
MATRVSKRKQPRREEKPLKERTKIAGKVLDDSTVSVIVKLLNNGFIKSVDYPISHGKEAVVFRCTAGKKLPNEEFVALKAYKYETSSFRNLMKYIEGDPRFSHVKKKLRPLVKEWARKEFANLKKSFERGVKVPNPFKQKENVLIMEFLGEGGLPSAKLQDVRLENPKKTFEEVVENMKKMYQARLVHADLSSYNIVIHKGEAYLIDVSQAVLLDHPLAKEFLERDVENIAKYFKKEGVEKAETEGITQEITR